VCDAQGVRLSSSTVGYGLTGSALNAAVFGSVHRVRGGAAGPVRAALAANSRVATFGAAAAMLSYLLILWVWERTQIAVGAALRDTSIAFAALIAVVALDERMNRTRVAAVALVAAGAGVLRFA
ncbi:MAG TPA: EamA family transporter, partial [Thermomicrobiales bacterium]|nr:EamA family transporter [Thermomicrobiales bacterium]